MLGALCLEDGFVAYGELRNYFKDVAGEVVFTTGMTGYEDSLTDPSYCGQILVFSYPLVGNYGIPPASGQSPGITVRGIVVRDLWEGPVPPRHEALTRALARAGRPVLCGVDTRRLVLHLRERGVQNGVIARVPEGGLSPGDLAKLAAEASGYDMSRVVDEVACKGATVAEPSGPVRGTCVVVDLGTKADITRALLDEGYKVVRVPPRTSPAHIAAYGPSFVLFSPGPGNPEDNPVVMETARALLGRVPLLGICLGHQIIARAAGARITRLKYGHHGANHPVKSLRDGKVFVSSQNHVYAVDDAGLPPGVAVTYRNATDGTIEGLEIRENGKLLAYTVQFHPEGGPGPRYPGFLKVLEQIESEGGAFDAETSRNQ